MSKYKLTSKDCKLGAPNNLCVVADDSNQFNFWSIFCFPYKVCSKICDFCATICTSTNQFVIFVMMIQWCICKITRWSTPDPLLCPYYFYMFLQILLLTAIFALFWYLFGIPFILPYMSAIYEAYVGGDFKAEPQNFTFTRLSFRKYCFRKSELFDTPPKTSSAFQLHPIMVITFVIESFVNGIK